MEYPESNALVRENLLFDLRNQSGGSFNEDEWDLYSYSTVLGTSLTAEPLGSAGAKAMHVLLGDYDAYIHAGGQYEWDSAAPVGARFDSRLCRDRSKNTSVSTAPP
ncbi:hypothetical protein AOT31_03770 [Corynebacterium ulcerans]|nr:hypothetical protein AOT31_03770 [Corynebacterium ulcerans]